MNKARWDHAFRWTDVEILLAIATINQTEGAKIPKILECVDYRQKMLLNHDELYGGLRRLKSAHLIEKRKDSYFVAKAFAPKLPRTATERLSWKMRDWYRLLRVEP